MTDFCGIIWHFIALLSVNPINSTASVLENAAVNQLRYYGELSFYHKRNRAEIDVILDKKIAFEVKILATVPDCKRLEKLAASLGLKQFFVVSQNYADMPGIVYPQFL